MPQATDQGGTKWVEVVAEGKEPEKREPEDKNLYIEFYGLNMTVGNGYPVESLIALLKEVCAA
jgi:hypothetical protein